MKRFILCVMTAIYFCLMVNSALANDGSVYLQKSSNQYLSITDADQTGLDISGDLTIEMWVNFASTSGGEDRTLISKWASSGLAYLASFKSVGNRLEFHVSPDGSGNTECSFIWTPSVSVWYHVAIVYDASTGSAAFYVNGTQVDSTKTGLANSIANVDTPFLIGGFATGGSGYFDGKMDEVRIWNVARTESEIVDNYYFELPDDEPGLVGYWKMDGDLNDSTTNGNNLTSYGSSFSTDAPQLSGGGGAENECPIAGEIADTILISDIDSNGFPEDLSLGQNSENTPIVCVRDIYTKTLLLNVSVFEAGWEVVSAEEIPDTNGNGLPEVSIFGKNSQGEQAKIILDLSGTELSNSFVP